VQRPRTHRDPGLGSDPRVGKPQPPGAAAHGLGQRASPAVRPVFRLRGQARKAALIAHVLSSVGWFGVAVAVVGCLVAARVTAQPSFAHALYRVVAASGWLAVPAGLAAAATGALLGLGTRYGLIRYWWVVVKILITVAVVVTDALLVSALAGEAAASGRLTPPLYASTGAHIVVLVIAAALSVLKPGGLTPRGRRIQAISGRGARGDNRPSRDAAGLHNNFNER
jgi:hypothetical protein